MKPINYILLAASFSCLQSSAQNSYPLLSTSVSTECISGCFDQDSIPVITNNTVVRVQMEVNIFEASNISSIQVKLGTTAGGSELLSKTFVFDVFGAVGNGCTYNRTDNTITLGLGDHNGLSSFFSEVKIVRTDASVTSAFVYNR